jgi:phosphoglycolate phosphatase
MKLVLFDIDGTLLISKGLGREAKFHAILEVFGKETQARTFPFGGKTDWQLLNELLSEHGIAPEEIADKLNEYQEAFAQRMADLANNYTASVLPGAFDLVHAMRDREDTIVGLVTGNTEKTTPIKLRLAGFDPDWFVVGAFGNESDNRNDLPKLALSRAIEYSGKQIQPHDVYVIGDTLADLECARALGAVAVIVLTGFEDPEALRDGKPDYLLPNLTHFWETVKF